MIERTQAIYFAKTEPALIAAATKPSRRKNFGLASRDFNEAFSAAAAWLAEETGLPSLDNEENKLRFLQHYNLKLRNIAVLDL